MTYDGLTFIIINGSIFINMCMNFCVYSCTSGYKYWAA